MDICHDGHTDIRFLDQADRLCRLQIGHGQANDVATRRLQRADLRHGRRDVAGIGIGHGLDDDGRIAADANVAHAHLTRRFPNFSVIHTYSPSSALRQALSYFLNN